jgi:hypothetical protein
MNIDLTHRTDTNNWDDFDVYFTLNEKIDLLKNELKRTRRKVIVNQFVKSHFMDNNPYDTGYFWVDDEYIREFGDRLYSDMLHYECVKSTIFNIQNEIRQIELNSQKYGVGDSLNMDEEAPKEEGDVFVERSNSEYDGEYFIGNDRDDEDEDGEEEAEDEDEDEEFEEEDDDEDEEEDDDDEDEEEDDDDEDEEEEDEEEEEFEEEHKEEDINTKIWVNREENKEESKEPRKKECDFPLLPPFFMERIIGFFSVGK